MLLNSGKMHLENGVQLYESVSVAVLIGMKIYFILEIIGI
jgi:hypothetical protein